MKTVLELELENDRLRRQLASRTVDQPRDTPLARSPEPFTMPIRPVADPAEPERLALPVREMRCSGCGSSEVSRLIPPLCERCISNW